MIDRRNKSELKGLTIEQLNDYFVSNGEQKFRGEQVFNWIYNQLEFDFDKMLNLSRDLREKLREKLRDTWEKIKWLNNMWIYSSKIDFHIF